MSIRQAPRLLASTPGTQVSSMRYGNSRSPPGLSAHTSMLGSVPVTLKTRTQCQNQAQSHAQAAFDRSSHAHKIPKVRFQTLISNGESRARGFLRTLLHTLVHSKIDGKTRARGFLAWDMAPSIARRLISSTMEPWECAPGTSKWLSPHFPPPC